MKDAEAIFEELAARTRARMDGAEAPRIRRVEESARPLVIERRGFELGEEAARTFALPEGEAVEIEGRGASLPEGTYLFEAEAAAPVLTGEGRRMGAGGRQRTLLKGSSFSFSSEARIERLRYWRAAPTEGELVLGPFSAWGRVSARAEGDFECEVALDEIYSGSAGALPWSTARLYRRLPRPSFSAEVDAGRLPRGSRVTSEVLPGRTYFRGAGRAAQLQRRSAPFLKRGAKWAWSFEREGIAKGPYGTGLIRPGPEDEQFVAQIEPSERPPAGRHLEVEWGEKNPPKVLVRVRGVGRLSQLKITEEKPSLWPGADPTRKTKTLSFL